MKKKPPSLFWQEVLERWAPRTKSQLARKLKVEIPTLNTWIMDRSHCPKSVVQKLKIILNWHDLNENLVEIKGAKLIDDHTNKKQLVSSFDDAVAKQERAYNKSISDFLRYAKHVPRVLDTLGKHCFFIFVSCTTSPYEMEADAFEVSETEEESRAEGRAIARAIVRALLNGTLCLYIRPTVRGVRYYQKWGYQNIVTYEESLTEINQFRYKIKEMLVNGATGPAVSVEEAERIVHENLEQCYVHTSPMWMPGVGLSMAGKLHDRALKVKMMISLPGGRFGGILAYPRYDQLEERFGHFVRWVVLEACKDIKNYKNNDTKRNQVQLVLPDERHVQYAEQFYTKLSLLLRTVSSIETTKGVRG